MTLPPPSPRTEPQVVTTLREYHTALDARETVLMQQMAERWLNVERSLEAEIELLARDIAERQARGEAVTIQMIRKMGRYRVIEAQLQEQIAIYNKEYAVTAISYAQRNYALLGLDSAQQAITVSYGPLGRYFERVNISAVENMIGFAGNGAPLNELLRLSYGDAVDGLTQALITGIGLGQGSGQIAAQMADGMGMGLERALLIARTETMRAYRTSSIEQYRQSGVVAGFKRLVNKATACLACLALDGESFAVADDFYDHPRGKCQCVPIVEGVGAPKWQTGQQWFMTLTPDEQQRLMGPKKYELYKSGKVKFSDFAKVQHNDTWGDSPRVATIKELGQ